MHATNFDFLAADHAAELLREAEAERLALLAQPRRERHAWLVSSVRGLSLVRRLSSIRLRRAPAMPPRLNRAAPCS